MTQSLIESIFGATSELTSWQMGARAAAIFVIALILVRISGRRSFGLHSPFDACTTVLVGAILSRAVVGASPFWSTVCAATALVFMHRIIGLASVRWPSFETLISGHEFHVVRQGRADRGQMRRALITESDLQEAIRKKMGVSDIAAADSVVLERNGDLTVIERKTK